MTAGLKLLFVFTFGFIGLSLIPQAGLEEHKDTQIAVAEQLQGASVTVLANHSDGRSSGSGSMVQTKDGQVWIWTAGHVVAHMRHSQQVGIGEIDTETKVDFGDLQIQQYCHDCEKGRLVCTTIGAAEVIRFSNTDHGEDLALLRLRDKKFHPKYSQKFYLDNNLPQIGQNLMHCGSLLGIKGSNSITCGVLSQQGRVLDDKIYDQVSSPSYNGSSGGVVALKDDGRYIGMLVMGYGESFGLVVPVRRMRSWAKQVNVEFALDPTKEVPDDKELFATPIEDAVSGEPESNERFALGWRYRVFDSSPQFDLMTALFGTSDR